MQTIEKIIQLTDLLLAKHTGNHLSPIQKVILRESLSASHKTYAQIAQESGYAETYIKQWVGPQLWQQISQLIGEKVSKVNCRSVLLEQVEHLAHLTESKFQENLAQITLESPEIPVPLDSPFYIEQIPLSKNYQEILQPSTLLRIKAPRKMGKTSLLTRILASAAAQNYQTVRLSFHQAETSVFASTGKFLRWICANLTQKLGLELRFNDYWDEDLGALISATIYLQEYLLQKISSPLILGLDGLDKVFKYPYLREDLLSLLRSWHEETKDISVWQKLGLILTSSTDEYPALPEHQSPFNVGSEIELLPFTHIQVEELSERHRLKPKSAELQQLTALTGGFPYLVRLAFYQSVCRQLSLENLLQDVATDAGIFRNHLRSLCWKLQQQPNLAEAWQQVLKAPTPLEPSVAFKLKSLGLVTLEGAQARVSCGLYQQYCRDLSST